MKKYEILFEELLPWFGVKGIIEVREITPPGGHRTNIIRTDQAWEVYFDFETNGPLNYLLCGHWHLKLYLEKYGIEEYDLPGAELRLPFVSKPYRYRDKITIPARKVPAGLYKLAASITMTGPGGIPGPVAGFAKVECLQFFDGGPISSLVPEAEQILV